MRKSQNSPGIWAKPEKNMFIMWPRENSLPISLKESFWVKVTSNPNESRHGLRVRIVELAGIGEAGDGHSVKKPLGF
jgi:hypothetical protein